MLGVPEPFLICVNRSADSRCNMPPRNQIAFDPTQRSVKVESGPERRAFLRTILGVPHGGNVPRRLPAERIALLRQLAARWDGKLAPGAVPDIQVSESCAQHGVCAAVCPTNALRPYAAEKYAGLEFNPGACIACGVCVLVCPEGALALRPLSPAHKSASVPHMISRHAQSTCARCDDQFAARGDEDLCLACRKDAALFTNGFSMRSDER
jgi:ferredoxin